jgi:co-chaperonin GroES (HSP10)
MTLHKYDNGETILPFDEEEANPSGLDPRGVAVLVKPLDVKPKGGLIELPPQVAERQSTLENQVVVMAIGPSAWHDEPTPRALVGETVLVTKFAGFMVKGPKDGEAYRLVNDRDIFCAITGDEDE